MKQKFFAVGHITNDLQPFPHVGGGVSYTAVAARKLGLEAHIITKCPEYHPYLSQLTKLGVTVHRLPDRDPCYNRNITTFTNEYTPVGKRTQKVSAIQESITMDDLANFPSLGDTAICLIAPVINEVDPELIFFLAKKRRVIVTPQGYFRSADPTGNIIHTPWDKWYVLQNAEVVILSDEDITFNDALDTKFLQKMIEICPLVIVTQGKEGATIIENRDHKMHIAPFHLRDDELIDFTGAGDTFAAGFIVGLYQEGLSPFKAASFASLFSALKIAAAGGEEMGLNAIPTLKDIRSFLSEEKKQDRIELFLEENGLVSLRFFSDGNASQSNVENNAQISLRNERND